MMMMMMIAKLPERGTLSSRLIFKR